MPVCLQTIWVAKRKKTTWWNLLPEDNHMPSHLAPSQSDILQVNTSVCPFFFLLPLSQHYSLSFIDLVCSLHQQRISLVTLSQGETSYWSSALVKRAKGAHEYPHFSTCAKVENVDKADHACASVVSAKGWDESFYYIDAWRWLDFLKIHYHPVKKILHPAFVYWRWIKII